MINRQLFNKRDILIFAAITLFALAVYIGFWIFEPSQGVVAQILVDGRVVKDVELSVDGVFYLEELRGIVFEVRSGAIAFIESDCPDQICVNVGFISRPRQTAACLPNRSVLVIIPGAGSADADFDIIAH